MKDTDLRGIILQQLYDRRREGHLALGIDGLPQIELTVDAEEVLRICEQLDEASLIEMKPRRDSRGKLAAGIMKITGRGVDVMEGTAQPPISIHHIDQSQHVTVTGSTGVQIAGDNANQNQTVTHRVENLIRAIDSAPVPDADKKEMKSKLGEFVKTPAAAAVVGNSLQALLKMLGL
jgi:hypothetical protein